MIVHKIMAELNKTIEHLNALYKMVGSSGAAATRAEIFEVTNTLREIAKKASENAYQDELEDDEPESKSRRLDI